MYEKTEWSRLNSPVKQISFYEGIMTITDPTHIQGKKISGYDKFWLRFINDKKRFAFYSIYLQLSTCLLFPLAVILYTPRFWKDGTGGCWVSLFLRLQLYLVKAALADAHCIVHRRLFRKNTPGYITGYLGYMSILWAHTRNYFVHHMGMHHVANNMSDDASSTPDSFFSVTVHGAYVGRFLILGFRGYLMYFSETKKEILCTSCNRRVIFYIFTVAMCFVNFKALFLFSSFLRLGKG